jgi:hypothetical protein
MELMRILHFANGLDTGNATLHTHLTVFTQGFGEREAG